MMDAGITSRRAMTVGVLLALVGQPLAAETPPRADGCSDDVMIVFDASGSMSGTDRLGIGTMVTRIDKVREALAIVLPEVEHLRRIGLMTYGPGPYNKCDNIKLNLEPSPAAAERILREVGLLNPAGRTPLTAAVTQAAQVLDYTYRPGAIVLVTDGEETCGGAPCALAETLVRNGKKLVVHVIGYRVKDFSWTGGSAFQSQCLAQKTGGHYVSVQTTEELIAALRKTLGCPLLTHDDRQTAPHVASSRSATYSAMARQEVKPGLSIP